METTRAVVRKMWKVANDVMGLELTPEDGRSIAPFSAGAHIDVHVVHPESKQTIIRQYSLWNGPAERDAYLVAVKEENPSRGGSTTIHRCVKQGDVLAISGPRNNFKLIDGKGRAILIAAGIGITPLLAMAQELARDGRPFALHYFARSAEYAGFRDRLESLSQMGLVSQYYGLTPDETAQRIRDALEDAPREAHVYSCGPAPFMDAVASNAQRWVSSDHIHFEHFKANPAVNPASSVSFEIVAQRSGVSCVVPPDRSITEVLRDHGVCIDVSCEQGVCGTCCTAVISGDPDHRDFYLSDAEKRSGKIMTPCCSRATSGRLVLDV